MKAIFLVKTGVSASEAFEIREVEKPKCGANDLLVKVSHFGLNYADVQARGGLYNDTPPLPCVLGYEVVGEVVEKGSDTIGFEIGDTVLAFTLFGGYAEFAAMDYRGAVKLNPGTNHEEATALGTQYCTAWFAACHLMNLHEGDNVLVHAAAGGVGTALVQIAKWKGCNVFGTASKPDKLEYLKSIGVDYPINYTKEAFDESIKSIIGESKLDVVFDPIGGQTFKKSAALLNFGGRIVAFGASEWSGSKGNLWDKLKLMFRFGFLHPVFLLMKSRTVHGLNMLKIGQGKPEYLQRTINEVYEHYKSGILKPTIDSVWSIDQLAEAHTKLESRGTIGKVVVKW